MIQNMVYYKTTLNVHFYAIEHCMFRIEYTGVRGTLNMIEVVARLMYYS